MTLLVSRSGKNPDVYVPPLAESHQPVSSYFLALDVLEASELRREGERRQLEFLRANPRHQTVCACGHHQLAHEDGTGQCRAKRCRCPMFRAV